LSNALRSLEATIADRAKSLNRQREFVEAVNTAASRKPPNYSVLKRLMSLPARSELVEEAAEAGALLSSLEQATAEAWRRMPLTAINEFVELAKAEGLDVDGQPPHLTVGRGVDVAFYIQENRTVVNGVQILSIDPRDVLEKVHGEQERLWGGKFDAAGEMARVYGAYQEEVKATPAASEGVPILAVYERVRASLKKSQQAAYTKQFFATRLSRLIESRTKTSDGRVLLLKPTASRAEALPVFLPDQGDWAYRGRLLFEGA
jgi:hypothetical protein